MRILASQIAKELERANHWFFTNLR